MCFDTSSVRTFLKSPLRYSWLSNRETQMCIVYSVVAHAKFMTCKHSEIGETVNLEGTFTPRRDVRRGTASEQPRSNEGTLFC